MELQSIHKVLLALCIGFVFSATASNEVTSLELLFETANSQYYLSDDVADPISAQKICNVNSAQLLSIQTPQEFRVLSKKLQRLGFGKTIEDSLWTSGISFSNSTVENLLVWTITSELITHNEFEPKLLHAAGTFGAMRNSPKIVRNRRDLAVAKRNDEDCDCNCNTNTTPLPPFTVPPCKKPQCNVELPEAPLCDGIRPPTCSLDGTPSCDVTEQNCTVECGPCRLAEQPVCKIKESSKPRCRLETPKCEPGPPNCTITAPGVCHAIQDPCKEEDTDTCKPVIKPCKNSCAESECTTVQPPCSTTPVPCQTTTVCQPQPTTTPCKMEKRCRNKRAGKDPGVKCEMIPICPNSTITPPDCGPVEICPPPVVNCPPPISSCTRPFVDCSPEICQSSVQLCLPPKISCPPLRISCTAPKIHCEVECSKEPEVICDLPELECTKPRIECPDAVVHCDPSVSTCEPAKLTCSNPEASGCKRPSITCGEPISCPILPPSEGSSGGSCGCKGGNGKCGANGKPPSSDIEYVENTLCISMNPEFGFRWEMKSCDMKHRFICEREKNEGDDEKKKGFWSNLLG